MGNNKLKPNSRKRCGESRFRTVSEFLEPTEWEAVFDDIKPDSDPILSETQEKMLVEMYLLGLFPNKRNYVKNDLIIRAYFFRFELDKETQKGLTTFDEVRHLYNTIYNPKGEYFPNDTELAEEFYFLSRHFEFKGQAYVDAQGNIGSLHKNTKTGEIVIERGTFLCLSEGRLSQAGLDYIMHYKLLEKYGIKRGRYLILNQTSGKKLRL